jgi:CheY-like chemotaxis protein
MTMDADSPRTALVVDDEPHVAETLAEMLALYGHSADTADNGLAALELLRHHDYQLIVSDLDMPRLDGPGLYREVARELPHLLPRLIFMTGDGSRRDNAEFLRRSRARCLRKPFSIHEVGELAREVAAAATA